jgi:hypothetical protein
MTLLVVVVVVLLLLLSLGLPWRRRLHRSAPLPLHHPPVGVLLEGVGRRQEAGRRRDEGGVGRQEGPRERGHVRQGGRRRRSRRRAKNLGSVQVLVLRRARGRCCRCRYGCVVVKVVLMTSSHLPLILLFFHLVVVFLLFLFFLLLLFLLHMRRSLVLHAGSG